MNKTEIIEALKERGYSIKEDVVNKNGVKKDALIIKTKNDIYPVIYPEQFEETEDIEEIIEFIKMAQIKTPLTTIDFKKAVFNKEYILSNVFLGIVKKGNTSKNNISFDSNIEGYENNLILPIFLKDNMATVHLNNFILEEAGLPLKEVIEAAKKNTSSNIKVVKTDESGIIIFTNKYGLRGAGSIHCIDTIRENFPESSKVACIPSSIHEWFVMDADTLTEKDIDVLNKTLTFSNEELPPEDVLGEEIIILQLKEE